MSDGGVGGEVSSHCIEGSWKLDTGGLPGWRVHVVNHGTVQDSSAPARWTESAADDDDDSLDMEMDGEVHVLLGDSYPTGALVASYSEAVESSPGGMVSSGLRSRGTTSETTPRADHVVRGDGSGEVHVKVAVSDGLSLAMHVPIKWLKDHPEGSFLEAVWKVRRCYDAAHSTP